MLEPIKPQAEAVRFTVDLDRDLHTALKLLAIKERCASTEVVRYALRKLITERNAENKDSK